MSYLTFKEKLKEQLSAVLEGDHHQLKDFFLNLATQEFSLMACIPEL